MYHNHKNHINNSWNQIKKRWDSKKNHCSQIAPLADNDRCESETAWSGDEKETSRESLNLQHFYGCSILGDFNALDSWLHSVEVVSRQGGVRRLHSSLFFSVRGLPLSWSATCSSYVFGPKTKCCALLLVFWFHIPLVCPTDRGREREEISRSSLPIRDPKSARSVRSDFRPKLEYNKCTRRRPRRRRRREGWKWPKTHIFHP